MRGLALIVALLVAAPCFAQSRGQPVARKQLFPSGLLNVHAPDSDGWILAGVAQNGISFAKRGAEPPQTYGAQAILFEMAHTSAAEELVDLVRKRIATMNPAPRFQELEAAYQYTETRGYPCVDFRGAVDDKGAGREPLRLWVIALYCRHPERKELGFFAAYSQRGGSRDPELDAAAKSFIEDVSVPAK